MDNNQKKKIAKLIGNRGFYILLALGLCIIGVSGYVSNNRRVYLPKEPTFNAPQDAAVYSGESYAPTVIQSPKPKQAQTQSQAQVQTKEPKTTVAVAKPVQQKLMLPIQGELTAKFSMDNLIYSKTMQDWRTHNGIDIRGDVGSQVKCANDGKVIKVLKDDLMGETIIVSHFDNLQTIYSNLQNTNMVKVGQEVKRGEVIGGVGTTSAYEIAEPPHLHFEVKKDNVLVDPFDYMSK